MKRDYHDYIDKVLFCRSFNYHAWTFEFYDSYPMFVTKVFNKYNFDCRICVEDKLKCKNCKREGKV